jgi:methylmalonyl-CoA/ethylmalonyl-CoA epimerase
MLVRRIDHTAVFVRNLDRSIAWYEDVLGLTCAYHGDTGNNIPGAFFDVGDTILAMLFTADPARDLSEQHFAFAVDSADAAYRDLLEFVQRANIRINPDTLHPAADLAATR